MLLAVVLFSITALSLSTYIAYVFDNSGAIPNYYRQPRLLKLLWPLFFISCVSAGAGIGAIDGHLLKDTLRGLVCAVVIYIVIFLFAIPGVLT